MYFNNVDMYVCMYVRKYGHRETKIQPEMHVHTADQSLVHIHTHCMMIPSDTSSFQKTQDLEQRTVRRKPSVVRISIHAQES
jgi:hypothetical protein